MRRVVLPFLFLALLGAGCDGLDLRFGGLDTGSLEEQILADVDARFPVDFEEVTCPEGIEPRAGDVFVCRVHAADGSVGVVEVTQLAGDSEACSDIGATTGADDVCVEWELTEVLAPEESGTGDDS